jgi:hypothetical protein
VSGTYGKETYIDAVIPLPGTDADTGLGAECSIRLGQRIDGTAGAYYREPGDLSCGTCGPRCLRASLTATPKVTLSGSCKGSFLGASITGVIQGGISGSLTVQKPIIGCGKEKLCVMGSVKPEISGEIRGGVSFLGFGGNVTIARVTCDATWEKTSCKGPSKSSDWDCDFEFLGLKK